MTTTLHKIAFDDGRDAEITIEHNRGADNTWASGVLFDPTGVITTSRERTRYLAYDCDTEIVAEVIANHLAPDASDQIWQILEDQMPECRCDLDDDEEEEGAP